MRNSSFKVFYEIYKPYKIVKCNSVYIFYTNEGSYVIKENPKINYFDLYNYLYSRSFKYVPEISLDSRDDMIVFDYQVDTKVDDEQKILDLINVVSLLHNKTSYYKDVVNDKYKEIYDDINNNLMYVESYYDSWFNNFINKDYNSPSEYLFLRNYSIIYNAIGYCKSNLDKWFNSIKDKTKQRVCLVHNNLKLEHFIKNDNDYLISWDCYIIDTPVLDLVKFYKNEWERVSFIQALELYCSRFELLLEEKLLFNILISIPFIVNETDEYIKCIEIRRLINYLIKSSNTILEGPD